MQMQIKALRQKAGLTQVKLAELLGYGSSSVITMWENGERKPPSDKLPQLATILSCTIDDLFKDDLCEEVKKCEDLSSAE